MESSNSVKLGALLRGLFDKLPDRELTTHSAVSLAVPDLADVCVLDMLEPDGRIGRREAATHIEAKREPLRELGRYRPDLRASHPSAIALNAGHSVFVGSVNDERLASWTRDPGHLAALRAVGPRSTLAVPLARRREVIGALTLHRLEGRIAFTPDDLVLVEEVARFAALALDNARLFEALERARQEAAASRDRLRDMLMRAPFAIAVRRGPKHVLELSNARYDELVGALDAPGKAFSEAFPEREEARHNLDRIYRAGEVESGRELRLDLTDRNEIYVDYTVQPTRDVNGDVDGLVTFAVDVSEQVKAR